MNTLLDAAAASQIKVIVVLLAIDVVLGIIAALIKKNFVLGKLAGFMQKGVVGYVFGFAVLAAVEKVVPSLAMVVNLAYWLVVLSLVGSILDNLSKSGVPMPKFLRK